MPERTGGDGGDEGCVDISATGGEVSDSAAIGRFDRGGTPATPRALTGDDDGAEGIAGDDGAEGAAVTDRFPGVPAGTGASVVDGPVVSREAGCVEMTAGATGDVAVAGDGDTAGMPEREGDAEDDDSGESASGRGFCTLGMLTGPDVSPGELLEG